MNFLLLVIVVLVMVAALVVVAKAKKGGGIGDAPWPFYAKKPLSSPEQVLYSASAKPFQSTSFWRRSGCLAFSASKRATTSVSGSTA